MFLHIFSESSLLVRCVIVLALTYLFPKLFRLIKINILPGPWGMPVLGYLPYVYFGGKLHVILYKLFQKYGNIFTICLGQRVFVVLSDPIIIREAFNTPAFSGRPMTPLYSMFKGFGVLNTRGKMWKEERRFLHQELIKLGMKKFGAGRHQMETKIVSEVRHFLKNIRSEGGRPIDLDQFLTAFSTNVITSFLTSARYDAWDPIFLKHKKINGEGFKLFARLDLINYFWALQFMPNVRTDMKKLEANHCQSMEFFKTVINDRRKTFEQDDNKDVLDAYMAIEYERKDIIKNFDEQVAQVLCDLVTAGSESVKTTINWIMVYLIHHPDVVKKMKNEIDQNVSNNSLPKMNDQSTLIYCQAVINEVMRMANVVPVTPNHATELDYNLRGHFIPKGSSVVALLYACHMSPKYWDNPEEFRPERFICDQGRLRNPKAFIPFGKGQRNCLGDTMARSEVFLAVTSLVQNFSIHNPANAPLPSKDGVPGVTLCPKEFKVCLRPLRNSYQ